MLVNQRRIRREPFFEIDDRIDRIDLDDDIANRILGDVAAVCDDHRDRLADVTHLVFRERQLRASVKDEIRNRRRRNQNRPRLEVVAQVGGRVDGVHARPQPCRRHVDARDAPVRVLAAHERDVQHSRKLHVVDEQRAARQQARVFVPRNASPKVRWSGWQA